MSRRARGVTRIFLYNWPIYGATFGVIVATSLLSCRVGGPFTALLVAGAAVATIWSVVSLAVSFYVYDRSALSSASWVGAFLPTRVETWASVDAGLDGEVALEDVIPGACIARLDVYDGETVYAPSVQRARALTPRKHVATSARASALTLADASCDLVTVVFTAHEIRAAAMREAFFAEVRRALRPGGRMLLVEHVRDAVNFCAFGPGFLHFQPRAEWLRLARVAGFSVVEEARVTPWVMVLALEKSP